MFDWIKKGLSDDAGAMDEARVSAVILVLAYVGHSLVAIVMSSNHAFDAQQWGIGAGALCTGVGALFGLRKGN